uniref:Serpin domain-containing protein n=1 Tax=Pyxicephalus adspersus TaxID=30357 RepID=A0AAV2ZQ82_PYXAD|nr:TPA: hypothetical protein GDO54_005622 [Pyxicephalus adspersus]
MRVLLCLSGLALLWLVVFAGPHKDKGKKHDHKDGHEKKGDHQNHDHHQHHDHHHDHHKVSDSSTKFAFDLYRQVAADHPEDNIALSPISISTALAFVSLGAKSKTHDQILEGIGFNISETREKEIHDAFHHLLDELNADDRELRLDSGNGLFIGQTWKILNDFLEKAKNYRSEAFTVNFEDNEEVKEQINSYIEKKTRQTRKWEKPFDPQHTKEGDFHVNRNLTVKVPFMTRTGNYKVAKLDEAIVVSLPYKGNASAIFILPKEDKMKEVEQNLGDIMQKYKKSAQRDIPKISISASINLKEVLSKLGIVDVFSNSADLSRITGAPNLKISQAVHKAKINMDEIGTEAAGTTVLEIIPMKMPVVINFNRSFLLTIYDTNTETNLFMGKLVNPAQ